jgi:hypothetical protein
LNFNKNDEINQARNIKYNFSKQPNKILLEQINKNKKETYIENFKCSNGEIIDNTEEISDKICCTNIYLVH